VPNFYLGRDAIKILAIITMTIDHIGVIFFPERGSLRFIGRLAFPLFCYLIVLGLESTRNVWKYFGRLIVFAFIAQLPYSLAFGISVLDELNILFTLALGLLFMTLLLPLRKLSIFCVIPAVASFFLNFDYGLYGILLVLSMYVMKKHTAVGGLTMLSLNSFFLYIQYIPLRQMLSILSVIVIILHKRGLVRNDLSTSPKTPYPPLKKYLFYIYYPLHLALLSFIKYGFPPIL
jgi:hypothetical protein